MQCRGENRRVSIYGRCPTDRRLYPTNIDVRVILLTKEIVLRGVSVTPRGKSPFTVTDDRGNARETPVTKLIIGNVPMPFSNKEIMNAIQILGINIRLSLIEKRDRDPSGKLTCWNLQNLCQELCASVYLPSAYTTRSRESLHAANACQKDNMQAPARRRPSANNVSPTC